MVNKKNSTQKSRQNGLINFNTIVWLIIFIWLCILFYFWNTGYLESSNNETLKFVDKVLTSTEDKIKAGLLHIHVPQLSSLSIQQDDDTVLSKLENRVYPSPTDDDIHIIFSTDCEPYQDWQTLVVFHSATTVSQKGQITRIASGCSDEKKIELTTLYSKLYPRFHVHFTPNFDKDETTKRKYVYYNKPRGLQHWLRYASPPIYKNSVIALIDPDFIFLRPLTLDIKNLSSLIYDSKLYEFMPDKIGLGKPVGQIYGLGGSWTNDTHIKFNRTYVCGIESPCTRVSAREAERFYSVGPPYILHYSDMLRIADRWTEFVPRVFRDYHYLLAEMYAYSMASAHENLPHFSIYNYIISNMDANQLEGWIYIDNISNTCIHPNKQGIFFHGFPLPTFLHYCQYYAIDTYSVGKRHISKDIFTCTSQLLPEVPSSLDDIGRLSDIKRVNGDKNIFRKIRERKRNIFMLCTITQAINAAIKDYKQRMC